MSDLQAIGRAAQENLATKFAARERALPKSRAAIRLCANAIRAAHRGEFDQSTKLLTEAGGLFRDMLRSARAPGYLLRGFCRRCSEGIHRGCPTSALMQRQPPPTPETLGVEWAPYLNGLGEAVGELRRYILDRMRQGRLAGCEELLADMDEIYSQLITMDYPDAITGNLRRTTDAVRGILEKTRGDLTLAVSQERLNDAMTRVHESLRG